jgi:cyclopropane-fatty-acyl-phospholipid synthase
VTLTDPSRSPDGAHPSPRGAASAGPSETNSHVGSWADLRVVPSGPRARVAAAIARRIFAVAAQRLGVWIVVAPTGAEIGAPAGVPVIVLHRPDEFYARVGALGLIGFGESYMTGAWDSPDLDLLLTVLARDVTSLVPASMQRLRKAYVARHPRWHRNSTDNTRSNIAHHYDLSNDLFTAFLDQTMSYSSALFDTPVLRHDARHSTAAAPGVPDHGDFAAAQGHKIERLLDITEVGPGTDVLEIGTGWGELAIRAARRGATVRSITLSSEQRALAQARVAEAGYADRVTIDLLDYRHVDGVYDVVLSVEMIEAVGHEFLPSYFATIDRVLRAGGRAGIQAITMSHERVQTTLGTYTWINKYIFPGGFIPSIHLIEEVLAEHTSLRLQERLEFGSHYAETLRLWDESFLTTDTRQLGFDDIFDRMWHFYLTYCRAGFVTGYIDVQQLLIAR